MMEGMGLSHGGVRQPASALERFYTGGPLMGSNGVTLLQSVENSDTDSAVMQDGEEMKNGVMSSLRSPIAGDLASPQHCAPSSSLISSTPTYVAIKVYNREGWKGGGEAEEWDKIRVVPEKGEVLYNLSGLQP